jgi:hypothetical protein
MLVGVNRCINHALRQVFTTASREEKPYKDLPLDTLQELIKCSQQEDRTAKKAQRALALLGDLTIKRIENNKMNYYRGT